MRNKVISKRRLRSFLAEAQSTIGLLDGNFAAISQTNPRLQIGLISAFMTKLGALIILACLFTDTYFSTSTLANESRGVCQIGSVDLAKVNLSHKERWEDPNWHTLTFQKEEKFSIYIGFEPNTTGCQMTLGVNGQHDTQHEGLYFKTIVEEKIAAGHTVINGVSFNEDTLVGTMVTIAMVGGKQEINWLVEQFKRSILQTAIEVEGFRATTEN